jgi:lipopolysaccharide/colanic/teichoic acid biosynthesis glycosyltransferase
VKRAFDVVVSVGCLVALSPLLAVLALTVRLTLGSPVLFRQTRPGLHGRPFTLYKFRSMRLAEGGAAGAREGEQLTRLGAFLRSMSLDELPELWNVLRGDMSLVGPRPLLMEYLPLYTPEQARRHEVRPGITGWAQVNGRNAIPWEEKFRLDVWYVDHRSFWLDWKILALTVRKVFAREGISEPGQATVTFFKGT